ncbi:MAG: hypothetical protein M1132_14200 [Chloroflexi bacterium]|nr:hypothetical protein [Chloroflexota bacterium]
MILLLPLVLGLVVKSWWLLLFGACFSLMFLSTHRPESDDHLLLKTRWPSLWAFLTSGPREWHSRRRALEGRHARVRCHSGVR